MNVNEIWIIVISMLNAATLLDHSTVHAIWDTLELGSCLTAVSFIHLCSISVFKNNIAQAVVMEMFC